jgi:pyruvate kinase
MVTITESPVANAEGIADRFIGLIERLLAIRQSLIDAEEPLRDKLVRIHPTYQKSAQNLAHYVALRHHDLRPLQQELAELGLSSLGRAEAHVMATIDAVLSATHAITGRPWNRVTPALEFREGNKLLRQHAEALLGPEPRGRAVRIMVTMPTEAAADYHLVRDLVALGMDCMRVNCAYDGPNEWVAMAENLRRARMELNRHCRLSMDLAGPKLRVGPIEPGPEVIKLRPTRDVFGKPTAPSRILLVPESHAEIRRRGDLTTIPVASGNLSVLQTGDHLEVVDTRGSLVRMKVVGNNGGCVELESNRTVYLATGLAMYHRGRPGCVIRIGRLPARARPIVLRPGDEIILSDSLTHGVNEQRDNDGRLIRPAAIGCTIPEIVRDLKPGERVWFDDGRIGGVISRVVDGEATITITQAASNGTKLRANKGINLPDSELKIASLTRKDLEDLRVVAAHADIVGVSFVRDARDLALLDARLASLGRENIGILLKIETRKAFDNLPDLLFAAMRHAATGVMIARGDLAVECGFERTAEIQEEILWLCEAAHMPVVWATQVLEMMAKTGIPSRAEITDAAMGQRAECVMLNKGPHLREAVAALSDILHRMQDHQIKKSAMMRRLKRW